MTHTTLYCPDLTSRELDVLMFLNTWLTHREIGAKLHVTENTIKTHARSIYWKLGVTNRRDAVARACEQNII